MEKFFRKLNISKEKNIDLSSTKLPSISISLRQKSSTIIKHKPSERQRFNSVLKYLDIKLYPNKFRNPFTKQPKLDQAIPKLEEETFEDKEFEYFVDALLYDKANQFLLINKERPKPFDLLKAEIEMNKLRLRKKIFLGTIEDKYKPQSQLEGFWRDNVSKKSTVRWDVFEEGFISQFLTKIDINRGLVRKINWNWLLRNLIKKISNKSTEVTLVPGHPAMEAKTYSGLVVNFKNFESFVNRGKLIKLFEKSINFDTYYLSEKFKKETVTYTCGTEYKGGLKNFKRDGDGVLMFVDGSQYNGMFFNGCRHGYGVLLASGCRYEGYWDMDKFEGIGKLQSDNGSVVEGVWSKDVLRSGKLTFSGGEYSGYMNNYGFNGVGTLTSKTGELKVGTWVIGKLEGQGEHRYPDGMQLLGTFKNDLLEGDCSIICSHYTYTGSVAKSKPMGFGTIKFADGKTFTGEFHNGTINGKGTFYSSDEKLVGEFVEGKLSGNGEKYYKEIYEYFGEFYDSTMYGQGELKFKFDGFLGTFKGFFKLNQFKGYGVLEILTGSKLFSIVSSWNSENFVGNTEIKGPGYVFRGRLAQDVTYYLASIWFDDGGSYTGEWENEKPHGKGEMKDSNGNYKSCLFQFGLPTGKHYLDQSIFDSLSSFFEDFILIREKIVVISKTILKYICLSLIYKLNSYN